MNRAERRAAAARARRAPRPRRLSREDRLFSQGSLILFGSVFLLLFIVILTPLITGRCIKCVLTGEPRCGWMEQLRKSERTEHQEPHVHF